MHDNPLFQAIVNNPADEALRLIGADWFEEHGDAPRAEFIRHQCALEKLDRTDPQCSRHLTQAAALLTAHRRRWNAPLHRFLGRSPLRNQVKARRRPIRDLGYRRGFVETIRVTADTFLRHADILLQLGPIRELRVMDLGGRFHDFLAHPALGQLTALDLSNHITGPDVPALAECASLARLKELRLGNCGLNMDNVATLAQSPYLRPALLDLRANSLIGPGNSFLTRIAPRRAQPLPRSPFLERLRELNLANCRLIWENVGPLLQAPQLRLVSLNLNGNLIGPSLAALAQCSSLAGLKELSLAGCRLTWNTVIPLLQSPHLHELRSLNLTGNFLPPPGSRWGLPQLPALPAHLKITF
jgi:uncharacterized protein (TIGR02996 family)